MLVGGLQPAYPKLRILALVGMVVIAGCGSAAIKANQEQLAQQQTQLDQLKQEVAALQGQNGSQPGAATPPGGCDDAVMHEASRKGGERFAASDFAHALAYYLDAVSACPTNARAQLNLARTYESLGDSTQARTHYELAANSSGSDAVAAQEARAALARLHPSGGT
jgi:tetratricopeptide (TPR) repeat protein